MWNTPPCFFAVMCLSLVGVSGVDTRTWPAWRWPAAPTIWASRAPSSGPSCCASWWWQPTSTAPCWWAPARPSRHQCSPTGLSIPWGEDPRWTNKSHLQTAAIIKVSVSLSGTLLNPLPPFWGELMTRHRVRLSGSSVSPGPPRVSLWLPMLPPGGSCRLLLPQTRMRLCDDGGRATLPPRKPSAWLEFVAFKKWILQMWKPLPLLLLRPRPPGAWRRHRRRLDAFQFRRRLQGAVVAVGRPSTSLMSGWTRTPLSSDPYCFSRTCSPLNGSSRPKF